MESDFTGTLIEQGILGLWCMFMIFLYHQSNKRTEKMEERRDSDRREADERLDTLLTKVDAVISRLDALAQKFEEQDREAKMRQMVREASRGRVKTETKANS